MKRPMSSVLLARGFFTILVMTMAVNTASAQEAPKPLEPDGIAYGLTLVEWAVAWHQWFLTIPLSVNPDLEFDKTGVRGGIGQRTPVWFLPGSGPGSSGTRTVVIPPGQSIFFSPASIAPSDRPGVVEGSFLARVRRAYLDRISVLEVSLDGVAIPDVKRYRVATPIFSITMAPGNLFGVQVTPGKDARWVTAAEGYFLLLPPLSVGKHVLYWRTEGIDNNKPYKTEWTFNLIIQKPNEPLP